MSEYAPPPPKVKVTKKQLKQVQKNYEIAASMAQDTSEVEAKEKAGLDEELENNLKKVV